MSSNSGTDRSKGRNVDSSANNPGSMIVVRDLPDAYIWLRNIPMRHDKHKFTKLFTTGHDFNSKKYERFEKNVARERICALCRTIFTKSNNYQKYGCKVHPGIRARGGLSCCDRQISQSGVYLRGNNGCTPCFHLCEKEDVSSEGSFDEIIHIPLLALFSGIIKWPCTESVVQIEYRKCDGTDSVLLEDSCVIVRTTKRNQSARYQINTNIL